ALGGTRFDLRALGRDHSELGADEEGVAQQEHDQPDQSHPIGTHRLSPPASKASASVARSTTRSRSIRRPCIRSTRISASSVDTWSPGSGIRPSSLSTKPAKVS